MKAYTVPVLVTTASLILTACGGEAEKASSPASEALVEGAKAGLFDTMDCAVNPSGVEVTNSDLSALNQDGNIVPALTNIDSDGKVTIQYDQSAIENYKQTLMSVGFSEIEAIAWMKVIGAHEGIIHACGNTGRLAASTELLSPIGTGIVAVEGPVYFWKLEDGTVVPLEDISEAFATLTAVEKFKAEGAYDLAERMPDAQFSYKPTYELLKKLAEDGYFDIREMESLLRSKDPVNVEKFWAKLFGNNGTNVMTKLDGNEMPAPIMYFMLFDAVKRGYLTPSEAAERMESIKNSIDLPAGSLFDVSNPVYQSSVTPDKSYSLIFQDVVNSAFRSFSLEPTDPNAWHTLSNTLDGILRGGGNLTSVVRALNPRINPKSRAARKNAMQLIIHAREMASREAYLALPWAA
jgi:hypothetical protein